MKKIDFLLKKLYTLSSIILMIAIVGLQPCKAQSEKITISGTVSSESGEVLIGAIVRVMGGSAGTSTDIEGKFSLSVSPSDKISFSYVGYKSQEKRAQELRNAVVVMEENDKLLDEVVVIGYGTSKKRDLTGSVASVKGDELIRSVPTNIAQGLQGKIAGVQVNQTNGEPGGGISITIRGANSFSTNTQPLYIVDGTPYGGDLYSLNPSDIESIDILKDASSTAIYGSRGANGVVIVTTKRGKGKDKIEFSVNTTIAKVKQMDMLDAYTYALFRNEAVTNAKIYEGADPYADLPFPAVGIWKYNKINGVPVPSSGTYYPSPQDFLDPRTVYDNYDNKGIIANTDWQDLIFQSGLTQEYNLSMAGGSDKGGYSLSMSYLTQDGIIKNSGYDRYSLRFNWNRYFTKDVEVGLNLNGSREFTELTNSEADRGAEGGGIIRSAILYPPIYGAGEETRPELEWLSFNPRTFLEHQKNDRMGLYINASPYVEIKFPKVEGLKFRQNANYWYSNSYVEQYSDKLTYQGKINDGFGKKQGGISYGGTAESLLSYGRTFGEIHSLNGLLGFTYQGSVWNSNNMEAGGFPDDYTKDYNMGKATKLLKMRSGKGENSLLSYLSRVNYTLMDKYLFTATFRRDGSSVFTENNKYANFFSGAVAWRLSEESFVKNLGIFHNLKLRASYGQTGNQAIGSYSTIPHLQVSNWWHSGSEAPGYSISSPTNPDLKWETTYQYDFGLDMSFLGGRLSFVVDYYRKKTEDLLQNVLIANSTGYNSIAKNFGNVKNEGLEIAGNYVILQNKNMSWSVDANMTFNKNSIGGLAGDQYANRLWNAADQVFIQRNGLPIGAIYGYVEDGFWDNEAEVRTRKQYANAEANVVNSLIGEVKYLDLNGDGYITEDDKTVIGDTNPKYTFGFNSNFTWKGLTVTLFIQGVQGNDIFNGNLMEVRNQESYNIPRFAYDQRWTPETMETAKWPRPTTNAGRVWNISNRYVEDGSYVRLKNASISYRFDNPFKLNYIKDVTFSVSGTNLLTFTNYSWYDPDVNIFGGDASRRGVDMYSYPQARTFTFGVKVTL